MLLPVNEIILLTVKEMEVLCIFHAGSRSATMETLQSATESGQPHPRMTDITSLLEKLSRMVDGDVVYLNFEVAK